MHDPALAPNPPAPRPRGPPPAKLFGLQSHVHDMLQPASLAVLARIRGLMERYPGTVTLGECSSEAGAAARVQSYTQGARHLHMAYTLRPLRAGFDWQSVRALIAEAATMREGWCCWSFSNHDVERAASRWHPRGAAAGHDADFVRLLMALLLSLRGSVCLYQGEELGLTDAELGFADLRDPFGLAFWPEFRGRDGCRTPMPWQAQAPNAGFSAVRPWLPVPEAHRALAADVSTVLQDWRRFLAWRAGQPALLRGSLTPLDLPEPLVGFLREGDGQRLLCLFNLSEAPVRAELAAYPSMRVLAGSGFAPAAGPSGVVLPRFGAMLAALLGADALAPA
jgi:alpha-glucosidase